MNKLEQFVNKYVIIIYYTEDKVKCLLGFIEKINGIYYGKINQCGFPLRIGCPVDKVTVQEITEEQYNSLHKEIKCY